MRDIAVTVGPLVASSTNAIAQSQSPGGAGAILMNGSLSAGGVTFTVTIASPAVFTSTAHGMTAGQPVSFTTTGNLPTGLTPGQTYYVIAAGLAANTFRVSTTSGGSAVNTSGTQSGTQTATGRLDVPRQITIGSGGNDSAITYTITGTNRNSARSEVVTGGNVATVNSVLDYDVVTSIVASGAPAGTVVAGTNGIAGSQWVRLDSWANAQTTVQVEVTGTVNATVQQTMDDPNSPTDAVTMPSVTWMSADAPLVAFTANQFSNFAFSPTFLRVLLNSGTGSVTMRVHQFGVVPF